MSTAPGGPRPAVTALDRHVVQTEADPAEQDAQRRTEKDVESVVAVVEPAGGGDEGCDTQRHECDDLEIDWGSGALAP